MVLDQLLLDAVRDFGVEPIARADDGYFGVGVEEVEDTASGYLVTVSMSTFCTDMQL